MRGRKPNFVACVHCRQMKLACDGPRKFPAGCSRCTKAGKLCSVDPSFKRTKKREHFTAVEKELEDIKQSLETRDSQLPQSTAPEKVTISASLSIDNSSNTTSPDEVELSETDIPLSSTSIQGVQLTQQLAKDLLVEFFTNYHLFLPMLPKISRFIEYAEPCPFLFWTVLVIGLRGKSGRGDLYLEIADIVRNMAFDTVRPEYKRSLPSMQALLLLCHWPLPFRRNDDPSHSFVTLATNIGLWIGLHRPYHDVEFVDESFSDGEMNIIRRKTWAVCFITNISTSIQLGLPATVQLDKGLLELMYNKPTWLPETLQRQLLISRQALNICSTLGYCESSNTGLLPEFKSFIRNFEGELKALEYQLSSSWSSTEYINFLGCRMVLYTFALTSENLESSLPKPEALSNWPMQAYIVAINTIRTGLCVQDTLFFSPIRLQKMIVNAICFLLLLKCSRHYDSVDHSELCNAITQGWESMQKLSVTTDDFMYRACLFTERLSKYSDTMQPKDRTQSLLLVNSRMGANVSFSTLLQGRDSDRKTQEVTALSDEEPSMTMLNFEDENLFADIDWDTVFLDRIAQMY
ncbi:hypothetical protein F5884DRAFT_674124 [Xylogone sp. PMI_703]|nr:hypothetical protein F5884DRAFT_674124 [Xylogone sp. PMI_703]